MRGNTKKTEMKSPIDKVNEFEYLKDVGSTNVFSTTSVNFTSSALGNGWLVTKKKRVLIKLHCVNYVKSIFKNLEEPKVSFFAISGPLNFW